MSYSPLHAVQQKLSVFRSARAVDGPRRSAAGGVTCGYAAMILVVTLVLTPALIARACPFCSAVSQTIRQETQAVDAVVIASAVQSDATRNMETGDIRMKIESVLRGGDLVKVDQELDVVYYGKVTLGRRFMLSGVNPDNLQWSCLPVTPRGEAYVSHVVQHAEGDPIERLKFFYGYLQDDESMLSRDAYDEFAIAPYDEIQQLKPFMDHDQLVAWINEPEMGTDRKRLYLTMLGICGTEKDLPMLEKMLRSTKKSTRGGLDALIACYLTLGGEKGLPLIDQLFLNNTDASYADTYSAIMAIRFHGTEGDTIPRSALLESLHHVLSRKDLADLVIPDLARWQDWSQIDRLVQLFERSDPENDWVRVPVVNYLRACPLDKAKEAIDKLKTIDPDSVRRASTFFSIPVPAREVSADESTSMAPPAATEASLRVSAKSPATRLPRVPDVGGPHRFQQIGLKSASLVSSPRPAIASANSELLPPTNPWRLVYVVLLAMMTLMIAAFLLLTGGAAPDVVLLPIEPAKQPKN